MPQVASDFSAQADAQGDQGQAQGAEQQAQGTVAVNQQQQQQDDGLGVRVSYEQFAGLGHGKDFNNVISDAKAYQQLRKDGYTTLAESAGAQGLDGHQLVSRFNAMGAGGQQAQQAAAQVQDVQQQAQQDVQQGYISPQQAQEMVRQEMTKFREEFEQDRTTEKSNAEFERLHDVEEKLYDSTLDGMGFKSNPASVNFAGADVQMDVAYDRARMQLAEYTQKVIDSQLNPNDPDYAAKRAQPATADQIQTAADFLKPFFDTMGQQAMERAADSQETIPQESLSAGAGGRAQAESSGPTTPEQRKAQVIANVNAKRLAKGERQIGR